MEEMNEVLPGVWAPVHYLLGALGMGVGQECFWVTTDSWAAAMIDFSISVVKWGGGGD